MLHNPAAWLSGIIILLEWFEKLFFVGLKQPNMKVFCASSVESAYFDVKFHTRMQKLSESKDVVYKLIMSDRTKAIIMKIKDGW